MLRHHFALIHLQNQKSLLHKASAAIAASSSESENIPTMVNAEETTALGQVHPENDDARTILHQSDALDAPKLDKPLHPKIIIILPSQDQTFSRS